MTPHPFAVPRLPLSLRILRRSRRPRRPRQVAVLAAVLAAVTSLASAPAATARFAIPRITGAVATMPRPAAAMPVGKLAPTGCVVTSDPSATQRTVSCELWAMTGTTQVLGTNIPIWGFSSTGAAGSATAPGPVLAVRQGDEVTITMHNGLAEPMSLALPGQRAVDFGAGLPAAAATAGVATGGTATYTFTATRPGTYLYEAGHTPGGARQIAMGLAGALVVIGDGTAYGTAYDDESVLVLSEIDPAFNAAPSTFDLRSFHPRYRLINGKPFPSTDPVSTDQGHRVLLRYVNAGSTPHPMSILGGVQTLLAQDGHPLAHPEAAVVAALQPGATTDAVVTMPTGPESKVAAYESSSQLDNNGQATDDPLAVAFGGMLTFLDTAAPSQDALGVDSVGPVSTLVTASPNPSDALGPVTVSAHISDQRTGGSNVDQAEFVVDDAVSTGVGFGSPMAGADGTTVVADVTGTIPATAPDCTVVPPPVALNCLEAGKHIIYVRAHDVSGNWGVVGSVAFNLPKTGPATSGGAATPSPASGKGNVTLSATGDDTAAGGTITAAEYFIGAVGSNGAGTPMTTNRVATVVSETAVLSPATVTGLGEGDTHVFVHSKDSLGLWGPPLDVTVTVDLTAPGVVASSVGPNPTNGLIGDKSNPGYLVVSALLEDLDARGGAQSKLIDAEAFLDPASTTLAGGTGLQLLPVDGAFDSTSESVYGLLPLSQIRALSNGTHHVVVRGRDAAGNWGSLTGTNASVELVVDKVPPVLGALTAAPNPTLGSDTVTLTAPVNETGFQAAEYWLGTTDPGPGKGVRVPVSYAGGSVSASVATAGIPFGQQRFNLRVLDLAGNWSNAVNTTVQVDRPNPIFSDTFDGGNLSRWSVSTGSPTVTAAAGIPQTTGNLGMQVTLATGSRSAAYVTDNSPIGETTYHAAFAFDPNTLTGNTPLTLFEGRTATAQAFSLQYLRATASAARRVRIVMTRSGTTALTGPWVTLVPGAHTLRLDWRSGPATGATAGSLGLSVDGTSVSVLTGNTSTLRIESARLGLTAGVTSSTSMLGSAYFDSFTSTRYTIP
ncbi:MAG TPA: multicopper oxidase domain-containing protein [Intrasporangium sp.]|uniref:multicopper oxidase domain-containing protein n=1 Tax=Intrasporangium sp. TaxID=1925024 RepID=UPI002D76A4EB|nr:multicopper oxidase domain-containing protein [Intrasporangium sp.]HET7398541.1 multicopper oxidase domain-containing protein [Intrasporangium sp.]